MVVSSPLTRVRRVFRSRRSAARISATVNRFRSDLPEALEARVLFSGLPAGFQEADIGAVGTAGSSSFNAATGTFTVNGAGTDLFATEDSFHYVYTQITGNGTFVAHVASTSAANSDAPFGIDVRDSLSSTAANLFEAVTPAGNLVLNDRTSDGGVGNNLGQVPISQPYWLKFIRTGNTLSAYISGDGQTFGLVQSQTFSGLGSSLFVGLAVASHDPATLATGTFDHVAAASYGPIPATMQEADIGVVGAPGITNFANGAYSVSGAGSDAFGTADAFHYVYTSLSGNGSFTVHQTAATAFDTSAPGGIDLRSSLSPTAANLFIAERPDTELIVNDRPTDGGQGTNIVATPGAIPTWLRLTRVGNTVTAFTSPDGLTFTQIASDTLTLQPTAFVGILVASHDVTTLATSSFDNVSLTGSAAPTAVLTTAPNITAPQVTPYQFTVTYSDAAGINASTIGAGNITVTGPGGYTQSAALVSQNLANGTSVAATYIVQAPTINGAYTVTANANSVKDINGNSLPAGALGTFTAAVSLDNTAPTAVLTSHPAVSSTTQPYVFSVTYADNIAVKASTIGNGNIIVTGPNGFSQAATFISTGLANGAQDVAQYSIPAPAANGTYTVSILGNQVTDTSGNPVAAGSLGTFSDNASGGGGGGGGGGVSTGSISGTAISSLNLSPIAGRTITLSGGASTTTDASGNFSFANLAAGTYTVSETLPTGVILTDPAANGDQVVVANGQAVAGIKFASLPAPAATGPDLTATLLAKIPGSVIAGTKGAPLKVKITNIGAGLASGAATVTLFASPDGTLSAKDVAIATVSAGSLKLKTKASKTISVNYSYPTGLASGSYRIVAVVNSSNSIAETNYTDNASASTPVTIAPAFVNLTGAISSAPKSVVHGKPASVTLSVSNSGNTANSAPISVSLFESTVASFQAGDILLGTVSSKTKIKANSHGTIHVTFKTPTGVTAGNNFIVAVINGNNAGAIASRSQVAFS